MELTEQEQRRTDALVVRLEKELYTIPLSASNKENVYVNGVHRYLVMLLGVTHISGERKVTFKNVGWGWDGKRNSDAVIEVNRVKLPFIKKEFAVIRRKGLVYFENDATGDRRYVSDVTAGIDAAFLTYIGWKVFGFFIAEFMNEGAVQIPNLKLGRTLQKDSEQDTDSGSSPDSADMARFAHIIFDD